MQCSNYDPNRDGLRDLLAMETQKNVSPLVRFDPLPLVLRDWSDDLGDRIDHMVNVAGVECGDADAA